MDDYRKPLRDAPALNLIVRLEGEPLAVIVSGLDVDTCRLGHFLESRRDIIVAAVDAAIDGALAECAYAYPRAA